LTSEEKTDKDKDRCVAFQMEVSVDEKGVQLAMCPRTLEESIAYENFALLRSKELSIDVDIPDTLAAAYQTIYNQIRSDDFKKTDFALSLLDTSATWKVPAYIVQGLLWLETRLCPPIAATVAGNSDAKTAGGAA
jgi:hypothetical protein